MIRSLFAALIVLLLAALPASAQDDPAIATAQAEDLTSVRQIKHMQARWGHMALAGNWSGMADMLTDNAELVTRGGVISGRGGIEGWLRTTQGHGTDGMVQGRLNLHLWISPIITLADDGQSATGRWHELALTGDIGQSADWAGGTWVVQYAMQGDAWRIAQMRYYHQFAGSYADGWSHDAETLERAPYHYTPESAGIVIPERRAAQPWSQEAIDRRANVLLAEGLALNTVNAYGFYLDRGMYDDIVDLFSEDAKIEIGGFGSWNGEEGVRAFLTRYGEPGLQYGELNDHAQLMPMVNIAEDGSMALVRNIDLAQMGQHGGEGYWQVMMQTFLLRPDENGNWRITLVHHNPVMRATYANGWMDPIAAEIPFPEGGEPNGETQLGSIDFRNGPYGVPPLGESLFMPARGEPAPLAAVPNALARAEAFDGAENISNAYGYYIDQFSWRETTEVFSQEGWKELSYIGTFVGRERLWSSLVQRYGNSGPSNAFQAIHQKTQPYVTVYDDGTHAFIRQRLMQYNSSASGPGSWNSGVYENQIVKEDGAWRIAGMDLDYTWTAPYTVGWTGVDPDAASRSLMSEEAIAEFAPDSPLRGTIAAPYPQVAPMGFHFDNPVSGREPETKLEWSDGRTPR